MNKNKMVFIYGLILLAAVIVVLVVGNATGPRHDENEAEGQTLIDEKQNSIRRLEEEIATKKKEIDSLIAENGILKLDIEEKDILITELQTSLDTAVEKLEGYELQLGDGQLDTGSADATTMAQAMSDMKDIYEMVKAGNIGEAKAAYEKIPTAGFDDDVLAYYELLGYVLGIN